MSFGVWNLCGNVIVTRGLIRYYLKQINETRKAVQTDTHLAQSDIKVPIVIVKCKEKLRIAQKVRCCCTNKCDEETKHKCRKQDEEQLTGSTRNTQGTFNTKTDARKKIS